MKTKKKHGGARKGAGRKKAKNKKQRIEVWVERLIIKKLGGKKGTRKFIYRALAVAPFSSNTNWH